MTGTKSEDQGLTIGQLARTAGVNIETIRYYQRIGLIKEPNKPAQGYRKYRKDIADNIRFIKRAQQLGFDLKEIGELLKIGSGNCQSVRKRAEIKRARITAQIRDLKKMQTTLEQLIQSCGKGDNSIPCPIVTSLFSE